ncbi:MAG: Tim44/TimA family putative adaptor protein [Hyphomicrobium sp.]
MNGQLDVLTLISLIVAVVAIVKLRSVLGQRSEEDDARIEQLRTRERDAAAEGNIAGGEVITLPRAKRDDADQPQTPPSEAMTADATDRVRAYPVTNPAVTEGLLAVARVDRNFDPEPFLVGAKKAYEMIVSAFAEGNRRTLRDLLSREVLDGFAAAISDREARGEIVDQQFVGIRKAEIVDAEVAGGAASLTVRFISELITATRDKTGVVISGDPQKISEVTDVWTFSRDVSSRRALDNPNWKLVETQPPN